MLFKRMSTLVYLLMYIALSGCGQNTFVPEPSHATTEPITTAATAEPVQTQPANSLSLATPTLSGGLTYQLQGIPSGYPSNIRWSDDAQIVFFQLETEGTSIEQWGYELSSASAQKITLSHPWSTQDPIQESPTPLPEIVTDIPGAAELISVSPSSQYALFLSSAIDPTLTPEPVGESTREAFLADLWLWDQQLAHHLGEIQICGRNEYEWTMDEDFVVIQKPLDAMTACDQSNLWIINVGRGQLRGLMPIETFGPLTSSHSFSPSEDKLLVKQITMPSTQLYLVDLETLSTAQLKTPLFVDPVDWLDDNRLIIMHRSQGEEYNSLGLFNLQTENLEDLLEPNQFEDQYLWSTSLSPDKKWIVFAVAPDPSSALNQSSLWLTQLRP
jgi:hypothetical protein